MSTQMNEKATQSRTPVTVDQKLEVVVIPVADVDRAKRFYESLGWRLDADVAHGDDWRQVQMTPPGSPCSVMFGKGFTTAVPGSLQGTFLVVDDIGAARAELAGRGVAVGDVFHFQGSLIRAVGAMGRLPGRDPDARSYFTFASFDDPVSGRRAPDPLLGGAVGEKGDPLPVRRPARAGVLADGLVEQHPDGAIRGHPFDVHASAVIRHKEQVAGVGPG